MPKRLIAVKSNGDVIVRCCFWYSLGAGHDGIENTCSFNDQYIMAAYSIQLTEDNFLNAFTFSPCSISEFRIFLGQLASSTRSVPVITAINYPERNTTVSSVVFC